MKKTFTKVVSSILACVMLISMLSMSVSAAVYDTTGLDTEKKTGSLTLTPNVSDKKDSRYTAYQVLEAVLPEAGGQDTYEYKAADSFTGIIGEGEGKISVADIAKATGGSENYNIVGDLDNIAAQLENYVKTQSITGTEIEPNKKKDNLSIGYYLILETTITEGYKQTKPMLVAIPGKDRQGKYIYDVTVTIKDQPLETIKTIEEAEQNIKDSISQQVGKKVTFKIVQDVPKYEDTYKDIVFKVTDTMSKGLEFVADSVTVKTKTGQDISDTPLNKGTDYSVTGPTTVQDGKSTIVFDFSQNKTNQGTDFYAKVKDADQVIITYQATLTKDANFTVNGNLNEAYPTFGDDPKDTTDGKKDMAKVFSGGLKLTKKDADAAKTLTGAEFTVYTDEDCKQEAKLVTYKVDSNGVIIEEVNDELSAKATVDKNGVVRFDGLGAGTYYIKETKAPSGYIKLKAPIKVEVTVTLPESITTGNETATFSYKISGNGIQGDVTVDNNGIAAFDVRNTQGFTLPTTGGMGTYLFTIGGVVLIALAAVLLLVRSRKKAK